MSYFSSIFFKDENGDSYGVKHINNKPRVSSMPYLYDIAENNVPNHARWNKMGFCPSFTANVNTDIWSYAGIQPVYLFPSTAIEVVAFSSSANDSGTGNIIHSGTILVEGTTTSMVVAGENFLTTTAPGDLLIINRDFYGYITQVVSNTEIRFSEGLNRVGYVPDNGDSYTIIDRSATTGAQVVIVNYLDESYTEHDQILILSGTSPNSLEGSIFRINSFRVISAGSNNAPVGNLTLKDSDSANVLSYITAGFNRARNSIYTVPAGKTLYVTDFNAGYATTGNANNEYARITTRANFEPTSLIHSNNIFYPFTDAVTQNNTINTVLTIPTKIPEKTDLKISAITSANGVVVTTLRGWIE